MATDILDVIRTKRDGHSLTDEQIRFFVDGYTEGTIADEQASARKRLSRETWESKAAQLWDVLCGKEREQVGRESSAEP